jgi:outer membrane lipoprotein carrier protein
MAGAELRAMELHDNFGQTTTLRFSHSERNLPLAPALFSFKAPAGTDVIGD